MQQELNQLAKAIRGFLRANLDTSDPMWFRFRVLDKLTFNQQQHAAERAVHALDQLDLAALLRVMDQNWPTFRDARVVTFEARNWVKECQSIRNRWAHMPEGGVIAEDAYRDLDTILRMATAMGADAPALAEIRASRDAQLSHQAPSTGSAAAGSDPNASRSATDLGREPSPAIGPGAMVRLKARPEMVGVVLNVDAREGTEPRVQVFHDGGRQANYYLSQLEPVAESAETKSLAPREVQATLTAMQLRHPSSQFLFSLHAARIDFVPYQFRPVMKFIQADRPRLLIADEVGVGKTIEAGLIIKELRARRELRNVLVICPKPLVTERKWQQELKRFDEDFAHLDGATLRYCMDETALDGEWPERYSRAIVPYSLLDDTFLNGDRNKRNRVGFNELNPPPVFDLVIVDEAHHIRNTDTMAHQAVKKICENAEAVVFLSATPVQMGTRDLYNLLSVLRPDLFPSPREFEQMAEPNPFINEAIGHARSASGDWQAAARAAIERALQTSWGVAVLRNDPKLQRVYDSLGEPALDDSARVGVIRGLEESLTFANLINRTRRRDIGSFTTRKAETLESAFTTEQQELHDGVIALSAEILRALHGGAHVEFMLSMLRRQVASSIFGLAPLLRDLLTNRLSTLELSDDDGNLADAPALSETFRTELNRLVALAEALPDEDPKLAQFVKVVSDKQGMENNKILTFSTFLHTLAYLKRNLDGRGVRAGLITGAIRDDDRRDIRARFRLPKEDPSAIDVLLSSEVGTEGLDFQFCDTLVNYDLPWNPMKVEQRIGRIDRHGQKSETIAIVNLVTQGTVDAAIYERCLLRIGVFESAIGGTEAILGALSSEIRNVADNLTLTADERDARLQQLADNEINLYREEAVLEEQQAQLFGLTVADEFSELVQSASSPWLTPPKIANLVDIYLMSLEGGKSLGFAEKDIVTARISQPIKDQLLKDFGELKVRMPSDRDWEKWLRGGDSALKATTDSAVANDRWDVALISPTHPLTRQAAVSNTSKATAPTSLEAASSAVAPGRYPFAIYGWNSLGARDSFSFQSICSNPDIAAQLVELIDSATASAPESVTADESAQLERDHHQRWSEARAQHIQNTGEQIDTRIASLTMANSASLAVLQEQLGTAVEARIRTMRESQIAKATAEFERKLAELHAAVARSDITTELVVSGTLTVVASTTETGTRDA